jgi:hypothetical protein
MGGMMHNAVSYEVVDIRAGGELLSVDAMPWKPDETE